MDMNINWNKKTDKSARRLDERIRVTRKETKLGANSTISIPHIHIESMGNPKHISLGCSDGRFFISTKIFGSAFRLSGKGRSAKRAACSPFVRAVIDTIGKNDDINQEFYFDLKRVDSEIWELVRVEGNKYGFF
jgi:hypothetical protein